MGTFDRADQTDAATFLKKHLPRHGLLALATIGTDGQPWNVCLDLTWDHGLGMIWKSRADSQHSRNIRLDGRVGICVFSSAAEHGDFALYMTATAREVTDPQELAALVRLRYTAQGKPAPSIDTFLPPNPDRLYVARPIAAYLSGDKHEKLQLDLDTVREAFRLPLD